MAFDAAWRVLANAADAEDAVQEAFADAIDLAREGAVRNWGGLLRQLVTRRAIDLLRRRRGHRDLAGDVAAGSAGGPEAVAVGAELATRLRAALAQLPEREAEVFALRHFADVPNAEIASLLKLTPGAVGVALHKARAKLEALLGIDEE